MKKGFQVNRDNAKVQQNSENVLSSERERGVSHEIERVPQKGNKESEIISAIICMKAEIQNLMR